MRRQSSTTSLSWIPSEAIEGSMRIPFDKSMAQYDSPRPDRVRDVEALRDADRFRFANVRSAWVETDRAEEIERLGYSGGGMMQRQAPLVRRTPSLTIHADGRAEGAISSGQRREQRKSSSRG